MTAIRTASPSEQIIAEVTSWPGVNTTPGRRGELSVRFGRREIGHLHGDRSAHFSFPKAQWAELHAQGRIVEHPVFPGRVGPAARRIAGPADVIDVIELLRLNYERLGRHNR
jgi:luciferase-like monooxygenase